MAFIVGRVASAARRPHAADLASDRSDHSDASAACVTVVKHGNSSNSIPNYELLTTMHQPHASAPSRYTRTVLPSI